MTPPAPEITANQVARWRLVSLGLDPAAGDTVTTPLEVVRHHLAMQSQDWGASRWAIGSRLPPGARDIDVLSAYDAGEIVRSWPMRGTVHAVVAEDLHWMLELMGVRALAGVQRRWERLGIVENMLERSRDVAVELLRGGRRATRAELQTAVTDAGIDMSGLRTYHMVWYLAQTGTLVQGPTRDGEQELVLLDEWVPNPRRLDRDDALAEVARRWLGARGPATLEDLVHWSKLTKGDCRDALDAIDEDVVHLRRGGGELLMLRSSYERARELDLATPAPTRALAAFDEHLLGYRVRDDVLAPHHANLVDPGRNGVFRWTIVHDGQVVATWKRTRRTRYVSAEIVPFTKLTAHARTASERSLAAWGSFIGQELRVSFADASS